MTKVQVSRAGEHDISKSTHRNDLILDIHSSDIGIQFDLGSKKLLQHQNNMSSMLAIPGHIE